MRSVLLLSLVLFPVALSAQGSTPAELFAARKLDEAKAAYQAILAKDRYNADALFHMGRIADIQEKSGEAVDWYEKAVKQDDGNALYHFWLGSALGDEAQKASKIRQPFLARRVKAEFERAVALDPKMLDARFGLVDFYSIAPGIMGGSMDKAREQAAEIGKLNTMRGHMARARIALREKNDSAAFAAYEAAIATAPDSTPAYYSLSSLYRSRTRWADALHVMDRLIKARPNEAPAHAWYGIISANGGIEMERGERELKWYLANPVPNDSPRSTANVHFRLGTIYEKTGRKEDARAAYNEALRILPDHAEAKKALANLK